MFKIATYLSVGVMLWHVFQIKRTLGRGVGVEVIRRLKSLCGVGFLAVLFNSVANASLETQKELGMNSSASITEVKRRILFLSVEQLLDNHMLVYILLLSVFFLAGYVKLAIRLKSENESII